MATSASETLYMLDALVKAVWRRADDSGNPRIAVSIGTGKSTASLTMRQLVAQPQQDGIAVAHELAAGLQRAPSTRG